LKQKTAERDLQCETQKLEGVPTKPRSKTETIGTNGVKNGGVEGSAWPTRAGEWFGI